MTPAAKREKSLTHWRRISALILFGGLMLAALAYAGTGRATIETPPPPSVWSDKADYAPGEQVTLSGANWAPGESVHIRVNDDAGETWRRDVDVTADENGAISDQFNLPDWFVAVYSVTARGTSSETATWSFTDASLTIHRGPTGNPPNVSFTITYQPFSNNTCTTGGGTIRTAPVTVDAGTGLGGLGGGQGGFIKLTAPTTPTTPSNYTFQDWSTGPASENPITTTTSTSVCVRNPAASQDDSYRATYKQANTAPVCNSGSATTSEDSSVAMTLSCTDADGNALAYTIVSNPLHGTLTGNSPNLTYSPALDYNGSDSFTFKANDGTVDSATATVSVTVTEVNDPPVATDDTATLAEDGNVLVDVLSNDSAGPANESGQTLTVISVDPIAGDTHGTLSLSMGAVIYTPAANYNGPASFHYTVQDNGTTNGSPDPKENTGDVNVTVTAVNDDPTVTRDDASVSVNEGQTATNSGTFDDVDLGDSPPDHVAVTASVGTVTQNNSARTWSWSYVPPDGPSSSTVTVTATDDDGAEASVTFSLTVANVAPNPTWTTYSSLLYGPLVFGLTGSWSGSFADPGVNDDPWTATFAWSGVNDPSQTKTYGAADPKTFSVRPNFTSGGCGLTGRVTVTDKDGASASDAKTVSVGTGEFMPPMTNQSVTDKLKNGQVLPVKVRIADCNGNPIAGLSPSIVLKEGDLTSEVNDNTIDPITVASVSAADTTGVMRAADGFYIYNLRVNVAKLNTAYTVIITPNIDGYPSSMTLRHKIIATK